MFVNLPTSTRKQGSQTDCNSEESFQQRRPSYVWMYGRPLLCHHHVPHIAPTPSQRSPVSMRPWRPDLCMSVDVEVKTVVSGPQATMEKELRHTILCNACKKEAFTPNDGYKSMQKSQSLRDELTSKKLM